MLKKVRITGIGGGRAEARFFPREGQFTSSAGFDPDLTAGNERQASGLAVPSAYSKFSGSNVDAAVIAEITCPQTTKIYAVTSNGKLISYTASFGSETLIGTVAGSNAGGATYYNNYIYIFGTGASKDDVSRYGPLDQGAGASLVDNVWKGATLGSQAALTNTAYPAIRLIKLPNHWGWVHVDNCLYFLDFKDGKGLVHRISTQKGTYEGDTNNTTVPSAYGVLDLPLGYYPTSVASYGTSVAVAASQTVDDVNGLNQGSAGLFIWNPTNEVSFDQFAAFPDPVASALLSKYGRLYAFSGNLLRGCRVAEYVGGTTFQQLAYVDDGAVPLAGAVEAVGQRVHWGSFCVEPVETACVWAVNSRTRTRANDVQNVVAVGTQAVADQLCTALKWVGQQSGDESDAQFAVAASSDSAKEIYRKVSAGANSISSVIDFPIVVVGSNFRIDRIRLPLGSAMETGSSMELKVLYDDGTSESSPLTVSQSVQPNASRVTFKTPQITGQGQNNFRLRVSMANVNASVPTALAFPIDITLEVFDDEPLFG